MSNTSDAQVTPVASVYAKSLFELATDAGGNDVVLEIANELEQLVELTATEKALGLFFHPLSLMKQAATHHLKRCSVAECRT